MVAIAARPGGAATMTEEGGPPAVGVETLVEHLMTRVSEAGAYARPLFGST